MKVLARGFLAALGAYTATRLFLALHGEPVNAFEFVPAVASLASPSLGSSLAALVPPLLLYLHGKYAFALIVLPLSLLFIFKVIQSWRSALIVSIASTTAVIDPQLLPVVLGILLAEVSSEDYREAFSTSLVFALVLFTLKALHASSPGYVYSLYLPGGVYSDVVAQSTNPLSAASLFYLRLFELLASNAFLALTFFTLVASLVVASAAAEKTGWRGIALAAVILLIPAVTFPLDILRALVGVTEAVAVGVTLASIPGFSLSSIRYRLRRAKQSNERKYPPSIAFADILRLARTDFFAQALSSAKNIVIYGPCVEDERVVLQAVLKGRIQSASVFLFHENREEEILTLDPERTVVLYVPPFSWEELRDVLSKATGFPADVIDGMSDLAKLKASLICRVDALRIAEKIQSLIDRGYTARKAFEEAFNACPAKINEEFFFILEHLYNRFKIVGFLAQEKK